MTEKTFELTAEDGRKLDLTNIQIDPTATTLILVNVEGLNSDDRIVQKYLDNVYQCMTGLGVKNFAILPHIGDVGKVSVVQLNK